MSERAGSKRKTRDADATRNALLVAARTEFQRAGYEGASTRKIAADAGCNIALISRYFGAKIGLFEAVMEGCIDLSPLAGLSPEDMASSLADIALKKTDAQSGFDPLVVAIRSSGSATAQETIRKQLGDPMVDELAALIGGDDAKQKAGVILSLVSGIYVGRVAIGASAMAVGQDDVLRPLITAALRAVLLPVEDGAEE
ncbi:MAG: TetR family transcriptional regulator [Pseudomonadota bacterium]